MIVSAEHAKDETRRLSRCSIKEGEDVTGRLFKEDDTRLVFIPNPLAPERVAVRHADVQSRELAKLSPMPEGLLAPNCEVGWGEHPPRVLFSAPSRKTRCA